MLIKHTNHDTLSLAKPPNFSWSDDGQLSVRVFKSADPEVLEFDQPQLVRSIVRLPFGLIAAATDTDLFIIDETVYTAACN